MNNTELINALKEIAKPYIQDEEAFQNVTEETNFIDDLKINSANLVDIVLDTEDKFDILIEDEEMEQMITVKGAMNIIISKINS
ncbi:MAG: acyl carrier protein [Saprospiraceae bacterium]